MKFIGNICHKGSEVPSDFVSKWSQLTLEHDGKWGVVQPSADQWNWDPLDKAYAYALEHNVLFKHHNFVWYSAQPNWVNDSNARVALESWITAFGERYPETSLTDVVNEIHPHTTPRYRNAIGGFGATGNDWAILPFDLARQHCPKSLLLLNDYGTIERDDDHAQFVRAARKLIDAKAQIDVIGVEAHDAFKTPPRDIVRRLDAIARLGLPIHITELDVNIEDDAAHAERLVGLVRMFLSHPAVTGITLWGYARGSTWRKHAWLEGTDGAHRRGLDELLQLISLAREQNQWVTVGGEG